MPVLEPEDRPEQKSDKSDIELGIEWGADFSRFLKEAKLEGHRPFFEKIGILGCGRLGTEMVTRVWPTQELQVTTRNKQKAMRLAKQADSIKVVIMKSTDDTLLDFMQEVEVLLISVAPGMQNRSKQVYVDTAEAVAKWLPKTPNLKQVIYISSVSVYGDKEGKRVTEQSEAKPLTPGGVANLMAENVLQQACNNTNTLLTILRLGSLFSEDDPIPNRLLSAMGAKMEENGHRYVNWSHLGDVARAVEFVRFHNLEGVYNVCCGTSMFLRDAVTKVARRLNLDEPIWGQAPSSQASFQAANDKLIQAGFRYEFPDPIY